MFKINTEGQAFLYNLLVNSKFRIWRHILFIVSLAAISFNQTYVIFQPEIPALGVRLYWIALGNLASYLAVAYLNIYVLVPRYLMVPCWCFYGYRQSLKIWHEFGWDSVRETSWNQYSF